MSRGLGSHLLLVLSKYLFLNLVSRKVHCFLVFTLLAVVTLRYSVYDFFVSTGV
jgi:hypothetical protein